MAQGTMPPALGPGTVLGGRYRLESVLGRGGMGTVYVAVQQDLGRRVALKVLDPNLAADPAQVERFRRESQAAGLAHHPNIVQITDFQWLANEPPILVMELLSGESLARRIERTGPLSAGDAARIASQVLSALETAHAAGIVHRDIKPDNVHLTTIPSLGEVAKVLDFGIAKLGGQERVTATGALLGTPAYMAPEQVRGEAVDGRTDLYGVGAVLYHALTGVLPHQADSASAMLYAILQKEPAPLAGSRPDLPAALVAIVARALAKDPAARFQSAAEMRAALAPIAAMATGSAGLAPSGVIAPSGVAPITAREMHGPTISAAPSGPPSPLAMSSGGMQAPSGAYGAPATSGAHAFSGPPAAPLMSSTPGTAASAAPQRPGRSGGLGCAVAAVLVALIGAVTAVVVVFLVLMPRDRDTSVTLTAGSSSVSITSNKAGPPPVAAGEPSAPVASVAPPPPVVTAGTLAPPPPTPTAKAGSTAPTATAPAPSTPAAVASAAPPPPPPPPGPMVKGTRMMSGKRKNGGGMDFSACKGCDFHGLMEALRGSHAAAIDACIAASQYEGPEHEHNDYVVAIDQGRITRVDRIAQETPVRQLDACISAVLKSIPLAPGGSGSGRVSITSECEIGWSGQCAKLSAAAADAGR